MKKTRMSIDDIHAMVGSIRANVVNMRVTNIYDLQGQGENGAAKTYILKLHQPPFPKIFLLLESGFTMKLRKHLRGKRLSALTQLEGDRVVDFTFGQDALQCHLILELYASGNIILTDGEYRILSLLRTHRFDENVKMAVKQVYPVQLLGDQETQSSIQTQTQLLEFVSKWFEEQELKAAAAPPTGKTQKKKKLQTIKQLLLVKDSTFGGLGPVIIEHCLVRAEISPTLKVKNAAEFAALGDKKLIKLVAELQEGWKLLEKLQDEQTSVNGPVPASNDDDAVVDEDEADAPTAKDPSAASQKCGFIILKDTTDESAPAQFEEFTPFLYAQHLQSLKKVRSFDTFDEAVDEYFSRFEAETAEVAKHSAQLAAENKLAKLKKNQQQQLAQLREVQEQSFQHAQLIEANQQDVENVLLVIRSALASGMDWRGLEELVRYEQKNGNPVASLIHKLDLEHNRVAILLCDEDNDDEEDNEGGDGTGEEDMQAHVIWIDLSLSALANAREIYTKKKKAGEKVKKATEATDKAIALAEKNTKKTLEKQQTKRNTIYQRRKTLWFEKFHWFLTNEKYLVVAGKDAHQNELLVKRYLRKGDAYVHADLHGAATCIVRNHVTVKDKKTQELPPIPVGTLEQAGCMSVCRSNAWTSQVIAGAYWVHADQVSKTAPAGEYLTTGSFMIRGKKNYIQPSRLEMGLAVLFRIDESCIGNHLRQGEGRVVIPSESIDLEEDDDEESVSTTEDSVQKVSKQDIRTEATDNSVKKKARAEDRKSEVVASEDPAVQENEDDDEEESTQEKQRDGKKRLSAKERRDLKKGKLTAREDSIDEEYSSTQQKPTKGKGKDNSSAAAVSQKKSVRGKKGKMKKMKKKYADQDDEDRRLRMEALGHVVEDDQEDDEEQGNEDDTTTPSVGEDDGAVDTTPAAEVDKEYIRQQREKKEKFLEEQEDEAEGADFFDAFTGEPLPNDIVLFAMPMCAPYASLTKYKYKVKLTPGSQKKGKAAKQAMEHFFASNFKDEKDASKTTPHKPDEADDEVQPDVNPAVVQRELMKCIPENELVNCMVGPVKISAPGMYGPNAGGKKGGKRPSGKPKKKGKK
ncbi:hypothetical protein BBO99_00004034 [Phytophthora kernoviae]|uniref:NFACT RNA-binding domain-containing protein n=2 Tax=Phytophthora kernoviae TaxID=325452 RepID=A0A3R7NHL6_9STRA|nr:hypothetical protein G195_004565 [Phytophthora kernoviae 00238/432]KAG2523679.1 hypothetical protein JM16_005266 [Phytophthora kernoviae]KAG2528264.1 hypothetical protein JM18_003326 [Phytophthora kernoviae]RLN21505.1 hypothetical protein BBI17_004140 [Phytophthora kernoviae]RLN81058.1 hypothetical protein BBO99_00004034 [Phytophthora kernoviae]